MKFVAGLIGFLFLTACSGNNESGSLQQELMEVDRSFSRLSSESGMNQAFSSYCAADGVLLRSGSMPVVGYEAITGLLDKTDDSTFTLTWEPMHATVARSGELGYTYGVYTLKIKSTDHIEKGTYLSIWTRENGAWKFVLDTGNEGVGD